MAGDVIILEGIDGSGKSTQYNMLCQRMAEAGYPFMKVSFPRYDRPSSALVRQYLGGEFGFDPGDVNPYAASTFYAVDRFASYKEDWGKYYESGGLILAARYTTSNAAHQGSKLPPEERIAYFDWLYNFEFNLLGLPAPSLVLYLDISVDTAMIRMAARQMATGTAADIHETDTAYLLSCLEAGRVAADYYGWHKIPCEEGSRMRVVDEINDDIFTCVTDFLRKRGCEK